MGVDHALICAYKTIGRAVDGSIGKILMRTSPLAAKSLWQSDIEVTKRRISEKAHIQPG